MEQVNLRFKSLEKALLRLSESLTFFAKEKPSAPFYTQLRDSVIQRFEFCVDIFWKCLKDHLEAKHGIKVASPKSAFRESAAQDIISLHEFQILEKMIDSRNESSHRYDEIMANDIAIQVGDYHKLMKDILERIKA